MGITILIVCVIFVYGYYAVKKTVSDLKNGKCGSCDCSTGNCHIKEDD